MNLCFVAHFALRALTGRGHGHIGGVERQTAMMAKWLSNQGHTVSVIVWDEGQPDDLMVDGVRILKVCKQSAGIPGLRFFVPRWSSLVSAMKSADAEIYYQNCAEYVTGQVALWARRNGRRFVYSVASDPDCDPELPYLNTFRERYLYKYGLRAADAVIVQTKKQYKMLQDGFDLDSSILPMPCELPMYQVDEFATHSKRNSTVLWVGRLSKEKRVHLLLDLAQQCPDITFDVVGPGGTDNEYVSSIHERCGDAKNVNMIGAIDFSEIVSYYKTAGVLCCTSEYEGFPNTFLEAWSQGLPIISTVDPDDVISSHSLGKFASDPSQLAQLLKDFLNNDQERQEMSNNALLYFANNHELKVAMSKFERLLQGLASDEAK